MKLTSMTPANARQKFLVRRMELRTRFLIVAALVFAAAVFGLSTARAANIGWGFGGAYTNPWGTGAFVGYIAPYQGVNVYCWTDGASFTSAVYGSTNRWFYIRWWAGWHWLYGWAPANQIQNQPVVGHC